MKNKEKMLAMLLSMYLISSSLLPNKVEVFQIKIPIMDVIFLIIIIGILILLCDKNYRERFKEGLCNIPHQKLDILLLILATIMGISTLYSLEKVLAIRETIRFASYLIIYFIIKYFLRDKKSIKLLMESMIVTVFIVCIFSVFQYLTNFHLQQEFIDNYDYIKRIPSTLENPNALAGYLILFLFPLIMVTIMNFRNERGRKIKTYIYGLLSVLVLLGIVLSGSRNGYVGIIIGIVVLTCLYGVKTIFAYGIAGVILLLIPQISHRIFELFDMSKNSSRLNLWKLGFYMIKDFPLLGVGNGNNVVYYDIYSDKYPDLRYGDYKRFSSHNSYIKIESELGLPGGITFILLIIFIIKEVIFFINNVSSKWWKAFYTGFLASSISFFAMNFFDNLLFAPKVALYFWVIVAIMESYKHNFTNSIRH